MKIIDIQQSGLSEINLVIEFGGKEWSGILTPCEVDK